MGQHIWTLIAGGLPTLTALFAWLEAKSASKKSDIIIVQTNGALSRMQTRNSQLAAELSKHEIPIPPPLTTEE